MKNFKSSDLDNNKILSNDTVNFSISNSIKNKEVINQTAVWKDLKVFFTEFKEIDITYNNIEIDLKTGKEILNEDGTTNKLAHDDAVKQSIAILKHIRKEFAYFVGGHFEPNKRNNANLVSRSLIVLDIDKYENDINSLEETLDKELVNLDYVAYSTVSSSTKNPSVRIVIKPSRDLNRGEYKHIVSSFIETLSFKNSIDITASTTLSQAMYLPYCVNIKHQPKNVNHYIYEKWTKEGNGEALDVDKFKNNIVEYKAKIKKKNEVQNKIPLNLTDDEIKSYLDKYPAENLSYSEWLDVGFAMHYQYSGKKTGYDIWLEWSSKDNRYKEGEDKKKWNSFKVSHSDPITFVTIIKRINDINKEESKNETINLIKCLSYRINTLNQAIKEEYIISILKSLSNHCTELEADYYLNLIKNLSNISLSILKKMFVKELKLKQLNDIQKYKGKIFDIKKPLPASFFEEYLSDEKQPKTTIENFKIILEYYGISIRRNIISREEEIVIPGCCYSKETSEESNFTQLISLCEMNNLTKTQLINAFAGVIAEEHSYNPILDCIKSKKWDGISRLKDLYNTIITDEEFDQNLKELLLRKWLISAIASIDSQDGIFSKGVLVFQGKQSIGKTSWFKTLVPKKIRRYFKEGCNLDPSNKDSVKTAISHWLVELGEIGSTFKKDVDKLKAFISSDKDIFRVAYGRKDTKFMRHTVFCGSVNESNFLIDKTGNVRFWVVPIIKLNYNHDIDMQQLWAEIYEIYKSGEVWWLDTNEEQILEESNKNFEQNCPFEEAFLEKYEVFKPNNAPGCDNFLLKSATELLFELGWTRPTKRDTNDMATALRKLGAIQRKKIKKFKVILIKNDNINRENIANNIIYS